MKVVERARIDKQDLRYMSDTDLSGLGVRMVKRTDLILGCNACAEVRLPR